MRQTLILAGTAVLVFGWLAAGNLMAEGNDQSKYEGREHIKLDREALKTMTREERRAAIQAYKAERLAEAQRAGITPSDRGYRPLGNPRDIAEPVRPKVPGTNITYDTGTVTGTAGANSFMLGNRFDSALNPPGTMCCFPVETTGSITMITFDMVSTFFSSAIWSLYSDVMGTTAMKVVSTGTSVMTGLNTVSTTQTYMNGTFLAGIWQFSLSSTAVGVDTGATGGQGFHATNIDDVSGGASTGTMLAPVTATGMGLNVVFRVNGNVATPVELMQFDIE